MRSARRKKYLEKKEKGNKTSKTYYWLWITIAVFLVIFLFLKLTTKVWNGKDRISLVYKKDSGDIGVTILNPSFSEITTMVIPADTEVKVARNYGTFLIKNVWQFGINEKIGGKLLAETVTQNFLFPTFLWCEKDPGFDEGGVKNFSDFIFFPGDTNIAFGDRLKIALYAINVKGIGNDVINLGESRFLEKRKLNDGSTGFVITDGISQRLTSYFMDDDFNSGTVKINITDATGKYGVSEKLGEILEVLGGKVVSIERKTDKEDIDCIVAAKESVLAKKIGRLFSCKITGGEGTFDLNIKIGTKFADRF